MESSFRAFVVDNGDEGFFAGVKRLDMENLPAGEVTIRVAYSSVNYKDGMAAQKDGKIVSRYPFVPGIDLAGKVVQSGDSRFLVGDLVLATGFGLGVSHFGGYSEYARIPADWAVPLPLGLTLKEAMAVGTAGFTAALSVYRMELNGLKPDNGPVVVTGATGGVGSVAVSLLGKLGYAVSAVTGKQEEHAFLRQLGASEVLGREAVVPGGQGALAKERWAGAVDPVGGEMLGHLLRTMRHGASVAVSGLAGGNGWPATVYPFILRGVNLLGIDSVSCPAALRTEIWRRLAGDWKPDTLLSEGVREILLDELPDELNAILKGKLRGRTVVHL